MKKTVRVLGTHGVPANYGGFETAAENISLYLVSAGWRVIVYCQAAGNGPIVEDMWNGIERVTIPVDLPGWRGHVEVRLAVDTTCVPLQGHLPDIRLQHWDLQLSPKTARDPKCHQHGRH